MKNEVIHDIEVAIKDFNKYQRESIPLCAAENKISNFCKLPLYGDFQERYIMGSLYSFNESNNFIGSTALLPFYEIIDRQCHCLFHSEYNDARTLSGMNCLITILMALTQTGQKIAIMSSECGGHASVEEVCKRLGLNIFYVPYQYDQYDVDYELLNKMIRIKKIDFLLLAPSDIIKPINIKAIKSEKACILYDASQILGLIAAGKIENPLEHNESLILFGGTHKTLPGPTTGLILTNNESLYSKLDKGINPQFLRNTQMHQVVSLVFALLELNEFGRDYMTSIINASNTLGKELERIGYNVAKLRDSYSQTHQIFIKCPNKMEMDWIYRNSIRFGISLNKKEKRLFSNFGIRLGTQEVARFNWDENAYKIIAMLLNELHFEIPDIKKIALLKSALPEKAIKFTFSDKLIMSFHDLILGKE